MIKFSRTSDFDFGEEPVSILKDQKQLNKIASETFQMKFAKTKGQTDVRVIALGADEGYGCFFKDALVSTEKGLVPIQDIVVGTKVLTHKGRFKEVINTFESDYSGITTELDISNIGGNILSTGNHPFLIVRADNFKNKHRCPSLLEEGADTVAILDKIIEDTADYVSAKDILPGDYALVPINIHAENPTIFTDDEAYLFGYYLSEGCLAKQYKDLSTKGQYQRIVFTMALSDRPCLDKLKDIIEKNGRVYSEQGSYTSDFGVRVQFGHTEYAQKLLQLFGCQSTNKYLSSEIFNQSREWKLKFLAAYLDGDGHVQDDSAVTDRYIGTVKASTASITLAYQLQQLLASVGITSNVFHGMNKSSNGCFGYTDHAIYQINIGGSQSHEILKYCLRLKPVSKKFKYRTGRAWVSSNYLVVKVNKVINSEVEDTIKYNLEVKDDNTYVVGVASHNSNRNGDTFFEKDCINNHNTFVKADRAVNRNHKNKKSDPKYGNIKAAGYNSKMKRIELVLGLDDDKCSDILHKIAKGEDTCWSMAAKISHDSCSKCGHKSYNGTTDRCDCIKHQLGEITKEGKEIKMINPNPNWFEISAVGRPADRLGYTLKYASEANVKMSTTDFLGLYDGFVEPDHLLISKSAADKRTLLKKLSEMEKHIDAISQKAKPDTAKELYLKRQASKINHGDDISDATIDELRKHEPAKLLKELADNGIIFSPEDFAKYLFGQHIDKKHVEGMKTHLPTIFSDNEDNHEITNKEKFDPFAGNILPKELKDIVGKLFEDHSLFDKPVAGRIMRITIIKNIDNGDLKKKVEKTASAFDQELADSYTQYKLATLNYLNDKGMLTDELIFNALIQNRK